MMTGWAPRPVAPLAGVILGGANGAVPVNGAGFSPGTGPVNTGAAGGATTTGSPGAGSGSASAGLALSTSVKPNTEAIPAALSAPKRLSRVEPDICIPPVVLSFDSPTPSRGR